MKELNEYTKEELDSLIADNAWKMNSDYYGLPKVVLADGYWVIARSEKERRKAARRSLTEEIWATTPETLAKATGLPKVIFDTLCELEDEGNAAIAALVEKTCGIDALLEYILKGAGYSYFLSVCEGEERELPYGYFAYWNGERSC